jgi:hypothetical protein
LWELGPCSVSTRITCTLPTAAAHWLSSLSAFWSISPTGWTSTRPTSYPNSTRCCATHATRPRIRTTNGPHRVDVYPDVLISLRNRDIDDGGLAAANGHQES